jgi:hypothetical protein
LLWRNQKWQPDVLGFQNAHTLIKTNNKNKAPGLNTLKNKSKSEIK